MASIFSVTGLVYGQVVEMDLFYDNKTHKYSAEKVSIMVNGEEVTNLDVPAIIIDGRTLVPARAIFEKMGGIVAWNEDTKEVYITNDNNIVVLQIDNSTGTTNGANFTMDVPPKIVNSRTMIPVRAAAEALNCAVSWDDVTRVINIYEQDYVQPEPPKVETPQPDDSTGEIPDMVIPSGTLNISSITLPTSATGAQEFVINANNPIEKYECFMLENNRIVVDIYNANLAVSNTNITSINSNIVSAIRSAQNQVEPQLITRVVFDLAADVDFVHTLSTDKKNLTISFEINTIISATFKTDGVTDYVTIYGDRTPAVSAFTLSNPNRLVIDMPYSNSLLQNSYSEKLTHVTGIRPSVFEETTTRIVLDLDRYVTYEVVESNGIATIAITKSTLDNFNYDSSTNTIVIKNLDGLSTSNFTVTDNYRNKQYILTLNGNYKNTYGYGVVPAGDKFVNSIKIENDEYGNTRFVIEENDIIAHTIRDFGDEIHIQLVDPKDVYSKIVVLDAGHGGQDPGASANGLTEKTINLDIMLRVYNLLAKDDNIKVYATRVDDTYPTNISRAQMGNEVGDLFISIHQNSATSSSAKGTEVLYTVHATDVAGKLTSQIAAQYVQNSLVNALGTTNRGIKNRADLIVLNQTTVPAILLEIGFLTNQDDANLLKNEDSKNVIANAIYSAIVAMMNENKVR